MSVLTSRLGSGFRRREIMTAYAMLSPWLIGFIWFTAIPMVIAAYLSFTKYNIIDPPQFIGPTNFIKLLDDKRLAVALYNTAFYAIISVPLYLVVSFIAALAMNLKIRGIRWYRTIFYLPSITPLVASAMLWLWIFNPQWGLANGVLKMLGLPPQEWLLDPKLSKPSLIFMGLWGIGPTMIIFLAGLQNVPEQLYEAAMIDGAGRWARFRHVTLPMLSPVTFFNLIIGIINAFQIFTTAYIINVGGAGGERSYSLGGVLDSLLFYVLYIWENAFQFWRMGYAAAMGWVLLAIILVLTYIQFKLANRWVYYETE